MLVKQVPDLKKMVLTKIDLKQILCFPDSGFLLKTVISQGTEAGNRKNKQSKYFINR